VIAAGVAFEQRSPLHTFHREEYFPVNKVILILSDALRYAAAVIGVGFLGHLAEYASRRFGFI
jgi:hypothetical protein